MRIDLGWRSALAASIIIASAFADARLRLHAQQCPPGSHIFIDPRLVPRRFPMTLQQLYNIMADPVISPQEREMARQRYELQFQPIQIPFRSGVVLVSPTDPCVQQYTGP